MRNNQGLWLLAICSLAHETTATRHWRIPPRASSGWWLPRRDGSNSSNSVNATTATSDSPVRLTSSKSAGPSLMVTSLATEPADIVKTIRGGARDNQKIFPRADAIPPPIIPGVVPAWKAALPVALRGKGPKTLQKICLGGTDIYLLGTAHVSNDSSADVRLLLDAVQPDCIFVELCDARVPILAGGGGGETAATTMMTNSSCSSSSSISSSSSSGTGSSPSFMARMKATQQAQGGSRWQALSTVLLTSVQEDFAKELDVELGGEFKCAHTYWLNHGRGGGDRQQRPHLILGDRPLHLTLVRAWESLSWFPKAKLIGALLWSSLRKPNKEEIRQWLAAVMLEESDVLTESFAELRKHFPTLYTTIISERDAWLAAKLVQTCRVLQSDCIAAASASPTRHGRTSIVAIVGAGHVPGISRWLTSATNTTPERVLSELVATTRWANDEVVQNEAIPLWIYEVIVFPDENTAAPSDAIA